MKRKGVIALRGAGLVLASIGAMGVAWASGSVEGKIVDRSGQPVSDGEKAAVTLVPIEDKSLRTYTTKVKKGEFFFGSLDPGEYRIELVAGTVGIDAMRMITQDAKRREVGRWEGKVVKGIQPVRIAVRRNEMTYIEIQLTVAPLDEIRRAHTQALLGKVAEALQAGDIAQTEKMVADLLSESPGDPGGLTLRAYVHQQLGRRAEAESDLAQALKGKPDLGDALYQLGDIYFGTDRSDLALETLGKVDASDAGSYRKAQAAVLIAQIHHSRGRLAEEAASLTKARSLSEEVGQAILPQLMALDLDLGKTSEAEALLQQATAKGKVDASLEYNLAVAFFNRRNYDQASKYFEASYRDDPKLADALKNLGICYMKVGDTQKAVERLKSYLGTNPKADQAEETRALIEALEAKSKSGGAVHGGNPGSK